MIFHILAEVPDEDSVILHQALRVVSENDSYSEMKKSEDDLQSLASAYCALSLYHLYKDFRDCNQRLKNAE